MKLNDECTIHWVLDAYQKPWTLKPRGTLACIQDCVHKKHPWVSLLCLEARQAYVDNQAAVPSPSWADE